MSFVKNFTVGPSKIYRGVADFMCQEIQNDLGELSHRSPKFSAMSEKTLKAFRAFFHIPANYHIFYTASATEGMEILSRGALETKSTHVVNGNFGALWAKQTVRVKKEAQILRHEGGDRIELSEILPDANADILAITANETSTGIAYSPEEIQEIRKKFPDLLFCVDVTSSMGAIKYDFEQADAWIFSVQKCFGMPSGLGILMVSPRLFEKVQERESVGKDVGGHHSLPSLEKKMTGKFQTPTTPNVLNIATLGFVSEQFQKDFGSLQNLDAKTKEKAKKIYDFFESHPKFSPEVTSGRSQTTIVIDGSEEDLILLHAKLKKSGITVGKGYGPKKAQQIRIANFPVSSMEDMENLLKKID